MSRSKQTPRVRNTFFSELVGYPKHQERAKRRAKMRRLLSEQLEPRQMLTADPQGDSLATALQVSLQPNQQSELSASIGDGDYGTKDVDLFRVSLVAGQTLKIDIDAEVTDNGTALSSLDSYLRLFNATGSQVAANSSGAAPNDYTSSAYGGYGGSSSSKDSYLTFAATSSGDYYVGVSGESSNYYYGGSSGNTNYNPSSAGSGVASSTGAYRLQLLVTPPPGPAISVADAIANEGGGSIAFVVSLSSASSQNVTFSYSTANGTATSPGDFTASSGSITFTPGQTVKTISVPVIDDTVQNEPLNETFTLTLTNAIGASIANGSAIGTITNNDFPPGDAPGDNLSTALVVTLQPNLQAQFDATIGDGNHGAKDVDLYRVSLAAGQTIKVDVDAQLADNNTQLSSLDSYIRLFSSSGTELANNSSGTSSNDSSYGGNSGYGPKPDSYLSFQATLPGIYYIGISGESYDYYTNSFNGNRTYNPNTVASGVASTTGAYKLQLLVDTPPTPKLTTSNVSISESAGTATVVVTLAPISSSAVSVNFATQSGSAVASNDFGSLSGTLTFASGESSKSITINIVNDQVSELDESFNLALSNPVGAELLTNTALVTILNDDTDIPGDRLQDAQTVTLVPETTTQLNEMIGDGLYVNADVDLYKVQLAAGQDLAIDLDAAYSDSGTPISGLDGRIRVFDSAGMDLTPGDVYRTGQGTSPNDFEVPEGSSQNYADDYLVFTPTLPGFYYVAISSEVNQIFDPKIVNSGFSSTSSSSKGAYRLQLLASVAPIPTLHVVAKSIDENAGNTFLTVKLNYASAQTVSVAYATVAGTATAPADFASASGTLVFAPGTTTQTIPLNIVNDSALEGTERFQLSLTNAVGAPIDQAMTEFQILDDEPNPVQNVRLVRDTGHDRHDRRTINPEIEGQVVGSFVNAALRVEFDHDEDGTVDGTASVTVLPADFVYDPRVTDPALDGFVGDVPMRYRFAMTEANGTIIQTAWVDFNFVLEEIPISAYVVTELSHARGLADENIPGPPVSFGLNITGHVNANETYYGNEGGSSSSGGCDGQMGPSPGGGGTSGEPGSDLGNPDLGNGCGSSTDNGSTGGSNGDSNSNELPTAVPVELDMDMDGVVDATTTTNSELDFSKFFATLPSGNHTIQARALEWNDDYGIYLVGAWTQYSFTWVNAAAPVVAELNLLHDTGDSDSDRYTQDPRIKGVLELPFNNVTDVNVEYDLNGDGVVDGTTTISDEAAFQFTPTGLAAGWKTIAVRSSGWDDEAEVVLKGAWRSFSFNYAPVPLPEVVGLSLLVDDGTSNTDKVTTNATLIGTVSPIAGDALSLYFDFDRDGTADMTMSPQEDGQFLYNPLQLQPGAYTINAWATRYSDIFEQVETGTIKSFSFTLVAKPQSPLTVSQLALVEDTGINKTDFVTSNPAISGKLVSANSVARLTVQIDVNGDGIPDGTTVSDNAGSFRFTPVGLALGPKSIAARGVAYNYATNTLAPGAWNSISFSLVATTNEPAIITELGLLNDSGTLGDNRTEDPRLTGRVLNDTSAEGIAVDIDVNGDGTADQTVFSDQNGRFITNPNFSIYGSKTVAVRAVEFDSRISANVAGPWQNFSFVYENQADTSPVSSNLVFNRGDVANDVLPTLTGKVRYQHANAGLRIEVDSDSNGTADLSTTTDAYGQFRIQFANLANNTPSIKVRSIATNPITKATQSETWQQLTINYVISAPAAATIVGLKLAEDTGTSSTDRMTTNPKIVGSVSRAPTGRVMIVEVDSTGDSIADGTTIVGTNLNWSYSPSGLAVGSVTVSARTKDTGVDGQTLYGPWLNFTFTLQSGVNSGGSSAEQGQQGAVGNANNQANSDRNAADAALSNAITSANQSQDASVAAAENQFNQEMAQAANAFALAQAAAAASFQSSLAAFAGNATSFDFKPLEWPDAAQLDRFVLPDDGTMPQPPQMKPDYQGPAFDFNSSLTYLAASNLAKAGYNTAISNAASTRRSQDKTAEQAYKDALEAEQTRAKNVRKTADQAYQAALRSQGSIDMATARDAYNATLQAADDAYQNTIETADTARRNALQGAWTSANNSYQSASNAYHSVATSAWNTLTAALNTTPPPSTSARQAAWNAYSNTMLAAGKTHDQAIADASHAYGNAVITANKAWVNATADAQKARSSAQNGAAKTYDDAAADHDNELRGIRIAASVTLEKAIATITRDTAKNNANALRTRDKQLATNAKTEQLAIALAEANLSVAEANAKVSALTVWDLTLGTPWSEYQLELANNSLTYSQSLRTARNTQAQALADAEKVRADAIADASHKSTTDTADKKHTLDHGYADAKSTYWTDSATSLHTATLASNTERKSVRDVLIDADHARAHQSADDGEVYARTNNDASHDYATTMISARTLYGVPASTAIGAGATLAIAHNNASRTLALANISNNQTWSVGYRAAWGAYTDNIQSASTTQSNDIAGDLKQFHETVAPLDRDYAIAISKIEGDESQAIAAAQVIYVQAVAPADKAFEIAGVQLVGTRESADANDLKAYRVDEATVYASEMSSWSSAVNSPWSAMYVNQGAIEIAWANATGSAEVAYVADIKAANTLRETTQAEAKRLQRVNLAGADKARTDSIADQNDVYVAAVAAAKYTYAMALAGISLTRSQDGTSGAATRDNDERDWNDTQFGTSAAYETAYQVAMINANTDYSNAATSASAAFNSAVAASSQSYWEGSISAATHQSNVDTAVDDYNRAMSSATDTYNTAAKAAWEALRDARAASLGESQGHYSSSIHYYASSVAALEQSFIGDKGTAEKALADAILTAKTTLANSNGTTEKAYISAVAPVDAAYPISLSSAEKLHSNAGTNAGNAKKRSMFIADAARREDQIAARGIYEAASYQIFASIKSSIATANPSARSIAEANAAAADAAWANAVRIARDAYEDALSVAGLDQITSINTAELNHVTSVNTATDNHTSAMALAESAYQIAVGHAGANLSVADAIGQATLEKWKLYAKVDYDIAAADAKLVLNTALQALSDTQSADVASAYEQYYLDAAGEWIDITWTDRPYGGYGYGWGWGWGYGYYGGYYGYYGGYYGWGGYYGGYYGWGGYYGGYYGDYYGFGGYYGGYGFGWGGWGLGYYWGYGFGGFGGGSSDAYSDLQSSLQTTNDTFNSAASSALATYATSIGDADIARATTIGGANINLADTRGTAGVAYATAINLAETTRSTATLAAAATRVNAIAISDKTYADALALAARDQTIANENAQVGLTNLEQTANVIRAGSLAQAEANFQVASANAQASQANLVAASSNNPFATYAAVYAQAKANWISNVAPAFVAHATTVATAEGQAEYNTAYARGVRDIAKANADKTFANAQSAQQKTRTTGEIAPTNTQLSGLLGLENARRLSAANHTKGYEHNVAAAEKALGIKTAEAAKQLEIDRANRVAADTYNTNYSKATGDGKLTYETALATAKFNWQKDEALDQQTFTTSSVPINYTFSTAIIGLDQTYQAQVALAEETRQYAHANAEGTFFNADTAAKNGKRSVTASADITLWTAQETNRVLAHTNIHSALQLPWSQYLVDAANARATWWSGAAVQYVNLANDRNAAETLYAGRLATAHVLRQQTIATATKDQSVAEANAVFAEATAKANSVRDYFTDMTTPTKTYVDAIAAAEKQKAIDIAQANRNYVDHKSTTQLNNAITAANNTFNSTKNSQNSTYRSNLASKQANQYLDFGTAEFNRTVALVAADVAQVMSRNNAEKTYRNEESNAYIQSATSWANIDAVYRQYEANSFAAAAAALVASHPSPWAVYDSGFYAAQAAQVTAMSSAARTNAIAQATAQKTAEITQVNAETTWRNTNATSDGTMKTAIAAAYQLFATAQSVIYSAMGGSQLQLPSIARPADLTGEYTVAAPHSYYRTSVYSATNNSYFYPYVGYWWGAWGYYGAGYWYGGYGSYFGYLYAGQVSSVANVYLSYPSKQFADSFWQIDADEVSDKMLDSAVQIRYGDAGIAELSITEYVQAGTLTLASVNASISDGAAYASDAILSILAGFDPRAAEYWALHGTATQAVISARPTADLGILAPELVSAQLNEEVSSPGLMQSDMTLRDSASAAGSLAESGGAEEDSQSIAQRLANKASGTNGVTTFAQQLGRPDGANLTPLQKLNAYLQGVSRQKGPGFFEQAGQISLNLVMGYINGYKGSITEYGKGFAKGFFIDGAWGNVEGIGTILKFGWGAIKQSWYYQTKILTVGNEWIVESSYFNFDDQRKLEDNVVKTGEMIFKVLNAVGTEIGNEAFQHYNALRNGSAADLQELGSKHQQVAAAVMSIGVLLSEQLRDMTPETRGRISGAITWEIAQTAAEIVFTAGAATVATKGAKFARIADKLADFAKKYDKLGAIAKPLLNRLRQISEPGGELRILLDKFDEKVVVVEKAVKVASETLENACFTPDTLVLTDEGLQPIGDIAAGQRVMAFDFASGKWTFREVKANTRNRYTGELVSLTVNDEVIKVTADHPFWVIAGEGLSGRPFPRSLSAGENEDGQLAGRWVNACDLARGDLLQSSAGTSVVVTSVLSQTVPDLDVCNLSVGENHCYAVGSSCVLVHNATWCSVLTDLHKGWDKIRANLAKKFNVDISRIHGHHIVQKSIPAEFDLPPKLLPKGKLVRNLSDAEFEDLVKKGLLSPQEQSAWYIGKSHELMKKADVELYSPKDSGKSTEELLKLLEDHIESPKPGKSGANLTLALNDTDNVHTPETQRDVYKRLKAVEGNQARTEEELRKIGEIFRRGKLPTATGERFTIINGKPIK